MVISSVVTTIVQVGTGHQVACSIYPLSLVAAQGAERDGGGTARSRLRDESSGVRG